jgi:molybdopterin-guanine dinucleotide biosynthesis protein A
MGRSISAVVLAVSNCQRPLPDVSLQEYDGQPLIAWVLERVRQFSDDVTLVAADHKAYEGLDARVIHNAKLEYGSLVGLQAGLSTATSPLALVVACDMPFLDLRLLRYMVVVAKAHDAVIPRVSGLAEPLHGLYRVESCLPAVNRALDRGELQAASFLPDIDVRYLTDDELDLFDPERLSFFTVRSDEEWKLGLELADYLDRQQGVRRPSTS